MAVSFGGPAPTPVAVVFRAVAPGERLYYSLGADVEPTANDSLDRSSTVFLFSSEASKPGDSDIASFSSITALA